MATTLERLAVVETEVKAVGVGIARIEGAVSGLGDKIDNNFVRKEDFEELKGDFVDLKKKKGMVQVMTNILLAISVITNVIAAYQLFRG